MKFLVAEDDEDLKEVLCMMITSNYDVQIFQASDGRVAIELLHSEGPFDLVISDFNMPYKNGADVYTELRKLNAKTPFITVSTAQDKFLMQVPEPNEYEALDKPFSESDLTEAIEKLISLKSIPPQKESYLPVSIDLLEKIEMTGVALYLKLNETQYIKVLKDSAIFDKNEANRFRNKKQSSLYVEILDIKTLISNFRKNVFAKTEWDKVDNSSALANLEADWSLILNVSQNIGWSESVTQLAKENIARTIALIEQQPQLKKLSEQLKLSKSKSHVSPHCYSLVFLCTTILQELKWDSPSTLRKMTFAALLHDMDLTDTMFTNKQSLISSNKLQTELHQQSNYKIFNHPIKAAEFVSAWTSCPPDVDKLILQHHEKFDGTGFPQKLNFLNIFPLAGLFIMSEDLIYQKINHPDSNAADYMRNKESLYNKGDFKPIYSATLKVAEQIL